MNKEQAMALLKLIADLYQIVEAPETPETPQETEVIFNDSVD
jgi:hypothetical protein